MLECVITFRLLFYMANTYAQPVSFFLSPFSYTVGFDLGLRLIVCAYIDLLQCYLVSYHYLHM